MQIEIPDDGCAISFDLDGTFQAHLPGSDHDDTLSRGASALAACALMLITPELNEPVFARLNAQMSEAQV